MSNGKRGKQRSGMKVVIETQGVKYEIYEDVTNITIETENGVRMKNATQELRLKDDDVADYYTVEETA